MGKIFLKKIEVKSLFGYFDYLIEDDDDKCMQDMLILYGDNGSGKTTLLQIVFYLLSTRDASGHKSKLANIKFKEVHITLSNNLTISAIRENKLIGGFCFCIRNEKQILQKANLVASLDDQKFAIRTSDSPELDKTYKEMLDMLRKINLNILYISDTRKGYDAGVDLPAITNIKNGMSMEKYFFLNEDMRNFEEIDIVIKNLEKWIQTQALSASNTGELKTSEIYVEIIKKLVDSNHTHLANFSISTLKKNIILLNEKTNEFVKLGLISDPNYKVIEQVLNEDISYNSQIVYNVLFSYIRAQKAKLKELESLKRTLSMFVDNLNNYFNNKTISYTIKTGFIINQKITEDKIEFRDLSSGEKQLVLLFCNIILASAKASIFIIDEPEISLNIKWQRSLLDTLLNLVSKNHVQFIIATHSIELLTKHNENVKKLINIKKQHELY